MTRGTKLYQQPRSPLIQGHSKTERPFWQPWLVGIAGLLVWVLVTVYVSSVSDGDGGGSVWQHASSAWSADVPWLVLGGVLGSAAGVMVARLWGLRHRWILAVLASIGGGYVLSWLAWAVGAVL